MGFLSVRPLRASSPICVALFSERNRILTSFLVHSRLFSSLFEKKRNVKNYKDSKSVSYAATLPLNEKSQSVS